MDSTSSISAGRLEENELEDEPARIHPSKGIYAFEVLAVLGFIAALFFLRLFGLGITWWTVSFTVQGGVAQIAGFLIAGFASQILYFVCTGRGVKAYLNAVRSRYWLLLWLRIYLAGLFMFYSYTWLKLAVPLINWQLYDREFWDVDQAIHGGISPNLFFTALFNNTYFLHFVDWIYGKWLYLAFVGEGFFSAAAENLFRARFLFSIIAIWTVGVWLYIAFPALGPVYYWQQVFSQVRPSMPSVVSTQDDLWVNYQKVIESKKTGRIRAPFNPSFGIAAMPSLHVGMMVLLFLWARGRSRGIAIFYAIMTVIIFIGSIVSGWHYAIDGYAGALIAYLSYRAALLTGKQ